tara:strand:- start:92 stop:745 length:654 start_codon:yes stop_codon:yes gene_type:complete
MNLSLKSTIIRPEKDKINSVIILLHGYGGDGKDISTLSLNWKRFLPNTIFFCPNGHERCQINPNGYQWFDLSNDDPKYILNESLNAEKILNNYINEIKYELGIKNSQICLSGFSQGCMMSINLGLTSNEKYNCVVGFSGKIIDQKNLSERITSKTNTLLIHGDQDQIVPPTNLLNSKDFLLRHKINIQTKMIKNCDHHIPIEASSLALKFIKDNLKI